MPTLQDVARHAGVSTATVSKVLSNTPYFTEETRQKVMEAVRVLGYRPNLVARALSSGKTNTLAIAFPYVYDAIFKDPLVMHILEGVEAVCTRNHYNILLSTPQLTAQGPDEHFQRLIQGGFIDGIIPIDNIRLASLTALAAQNNVPAVTLGYHDGAYSVRSDDFFGGQILMEYLLSLGHRRIGIISIAPGNFAVEGREAGLRDVATRAGIDHLPLALGDFSSDSGYAAARTLHQQYPDLTAVACLNDRMAIGALRYFQSIDWRIPQDISIVGYDNIASSSLSHPPLTTIDQQPGKLGETAAQMLINVLSAANDHNGQSSADQSLPSSVVLQPSLRVRASCDAPRAED